MAIVLTNDENYKAIANAIRGQTGEIDKLLPEQMAEEIDNIPNYAQSVVQEVSDARTGYNGTRYENLDSRIDGDINNLLDKTNTINYKDTTIHAENTYARNLVANRNKVEVLGQTIQNCLDRSSIDENGYTVINADGTGKTFFSQLNMFIAKPSTLYTFVVEVLENTIKDGSVYFGGYGSLAYFDETKIYQLNGLSGTLKFTLSTISDFTGRTISVGGYITDKATSGTIKFRTAIVEGDWTNKEISFVPFGLNYPETTEVVECGKNLFDVSKIPTTWNGTTGIKNNGDGTLYLKGSSKGSPCSTGKTLKELCPLLKVGKTYIINVKNDSHTNADYIYLSGINYTWRYGRTLMITNEHLNGEVNLYAGGSDDNTNTEATLSNFQIEEAEVATEYEPYTERRVNINKPLASVSDIIRDKYYVKDGKKYHEQIVKEIVFDGSDDERWNINQYTNLCTYIIIDDLVLSNVFASFICDKFAKYPRMSSQPDGTIGVAIEGIDVNVSGFFFGIKGLANNLSSWKQYLKNNPIKILYAIREPITTEIQTEDWYSFDSQTNITTTNMVKPTLDIDIPSDLTAVVSNLMVENTSLKQENQSLTNELENQKAVNEENTLLMNTILGVE